MKKEWTNQSVSVGQVSKDFIESVGENHPYYRCLLITDGVTF